jgi:hypothetical protein
MRSIRAAKTRSLVSDDQLRPIVPFEVIGLPETVISEGAVEANRGFGTGDRGLKLALLTASVGFNSSVGPKPPDARPNTYPDGIEPTLRAMRRVRLMAVFTGHESVDVRRVSSDRW